ncbi:hypothetical protein AAC387_Pa05g2695 [Persea americana]
MDVEKVFHMKEGQGEASYARNSSSQKRGIELVKHVTVDAVVDLFLSKAPQCFAIADLGCSSGPNTLSVIRDIIDVIDERCGILSCPTPEFQVFLNDLPTNDFNSIFMALSEFYGSIKKNGKRDDPPSVFVSGVPGSFYGRLFSSRSLHFIHSSFSLHWLSRVPPAIYDANGKSLNKGKMCVTGSSPPAVAKAYLMQFQEDFYLFLRSRSEELVSGGRMVLTLLGRGSEKHMERGQATYWELLGQAFASLVSSGEVEQEKVNTYDVHFYAPSMDEVKRVVQMEGSFSLDCLEMFEIGGDGRTSVGRNGRATAKAIRAIQESMILHHFGEGIIDGLFEQYAEILDVELAKEEIKVPNLLVVLRKLA